MKKTFIFIVIVAAFLFSGAVSAFAEASADKSAEDKIVFTEFGLSYGSVIDPANISDNSTGALDTAVFDVKAGAQILKWGNVYAGAAFHFYMDRADWNQHYTFFPLFGGLRANIFPEWAVYPSVSAEFGIAFANHHFMNGPDMDDRPWLASYYNFGIGANWNVTDISILSLTIERPSVSNLNGGEIHIFKTGLSWKILY